MLVIGDGPARTRPQRSAESPHRDRLPDGAAEGNPPPKATTMAERKIAANRTREALRNLVDAGTDESTTALSSRPAGRALFEERGHGLLARPRPKAFMLMTSFGHRHTPSADLNQSARRRQSCQDRPRTRSPRQSVPPTRASLPSSLLLGTTRFTKPQSAAVDASTGLPVNSISSARLRPIARVNATIGVLQKEPDLHPGCSEPCSVGRHNQVAGGHKLTACRRCHTVHLGDHGLRNALDRSHQVRADIKDLPILVDVPIQPSPRDRAPRRMQSPRP